MEAEHGIKKLTEANWLEPDKATAIWLDDDGGCAHSVASANYLHMLSEPNCHKKSPVK